MVGKIQCLISDHIKELCIILFLWSGKLIVFVHEILKQVVMYLN